MKKTDQAAVPLYQQHDGVGGSYVIDPATGVRTLVSRTNTSRATAETPEAGDGSAPGQTADAEAAAAAAAPKKSTAKGK